MTNPNTATRRERLRAETVAEIKERAWALMAESGAETLSLREVARQMGMAPSALYRYFPSRNDLLTVLIVDAFDSLAEAVSTAYEGVQHDAIDPLEGFVVLCRGYRAWAMSHRVEWLLIFSSSIPDYNGTEETKAASVRVTDVLTRSLADAVAADRLDLERIDAEIDDTMRSALQEWADRDGAFGLPVAALAAALWCYAALHGALALDLNEHLPPALLGNEALFETSLRAVLDHIARPKSNGGS